MGGSQNGNWEVEHPRTRPPLVRRYIIAYVVMPEHVHFVISEPERATLAVAIQMLKQVVAKKLSLADKSPFWQRRYYDRNVHGGEELVNAINYIHHNPVKRGLVAEPDD